MRARTTMTGLALTAGLALSMAPAGLASAGAPSADRATTSVVSHKAATTKAEQQRVEDYWTPARMKNAIPVGVKANPHKGKPAAAPPVARPSSETPQPQFGKVFFTERQLQLRLLRHRDQQHQRRRRDDRRTLRQRRPGVFVTNFAFVPAYNNNSRPYGTWTAQDAVHHRPSGRTARTTTTTPASR